MSEVNYPEYEICKRRGHKPMALSTEMWTQCVWCGVWLREKRIFEERDNAPPENERSPFDRSKKRDGPDADAKLKGDADA